MRAELKDKIVKWLLDFPLQMAHVKAKFRKGTSYFHLIRMVSRADTIRLWISEYPEYCFDYIKELVDNEEYLDLVKDFSGEEDTEEIQEYANDKKSLIQDDFLEFVYIDNEWGDELPETLFIMKKDQIKVGDIVYAPFYETRMYYGIHLACLDKNFNITIKEDEGYCPTIRTWQKKLLEENHVSFENALNYITNEYGDWEQKALLDMWQ